MLRTSNLIGFGGGAPQHRIQMIDFDGTNDYVDRGTGMTGQADDDVGIFSAWFEIRNADGVSSIMWWGEITSQVRFTVNRTTSNKLALRVLNSGNSQRVALDTTGNVLADSTVHHILGSWKITSGDLAAHWFIDDVDVKNQITLSAGTCDYTLSEYTVGAQSSGAVKWNGLLGQVYVNEAEYLDFSDVANRRKFINAAKKPVDFGGDGSKPTGPQPIAFFDGDVADWHTNKGTGGGFTEVGTLGDGGLFP